jgi:hypothetical protein
LNKQTKHKPTEEEIKQFWAEFKATKEMLRNKSIDEKMHQLERMASEVIGTEAIKDYEFENRIIACVEEWKKGNKVQLPY